MLYPQRQRGHNAIIESFFHTLKTKLVHHIIKNYEEVKKFVDKVSALGAKCAIDDFGSGYSSFEHILKLRVDYLKIDGSIIKNIDKDPGAEVIAKAIVSFAKDLKIKVVGEFVHSEEVFNKIAALGIEYAQGYFISPPKPNAA